MKALKSVLIKKIKKLEKLGKPSDEIYQCLRRIHNYDMFRIRYKVLSVFPVD